MCAASTGSIKVHGLGPAARDQILEDRDTFSVDPKITVAAVKALIAKKYSVSSHCVSLFMETTTYREGEVGKIVFAFSDVVLNKRDARIEDEIPKPPRGDTNESVLSFRIFKRPTLGGGEIRKDNFFIALS